ncbi:MAG: hypothetical protein IPO21_14025 [Bacteroidales bacterium]|nr:hypothetical protein [Bacteroidales bacterium]
MKFLFVGMFFLHLFVMNAQTLEGIVIEKYAVADSLGSKRVFIPAGSVTYRIYADLSPDAYLQSMFASKDHELVFKTSTKFHNHLYGALYGDGLVDMYALDPEIALDSWITIGAASRKHIGIPLDADSDGSVISHSYFKKRDGLIASEIPQIIKYKFDVVPFDALGGSEFRSSDAFIGVKGGVKGADAQNRVLLAQFTTDGEIYFELNLQLGTNVSGVSKQYVAKSPAENQSTIEGLVYGNKKP